jgi:signal transduction histidine kinase
MKEILKQRKVIIVVIFIVLLSFSSIIYSYFTIQRFSLTITNSSVRFIGNNLFELWKYYQELYEKDTNNKNSFFETLKPIKYVYIQKDDGSINYIYIRQGFHELLSTRNVIREKQENSFRVVEVGFKEYIEIDIPFEIETGAEHHFTIGFHRIIQSMDEYSTIISDTSVFNDIRINILLIPIILTLLSIFLIFLAIKLERSYISVNMSKDRYESLILMARQVAHEIRNPLNSMFLTIQSMEDDHENQQVDKHYLKMLSDKVETIDKVVKDFSSLNKQIIPQKEQVLIKPYLKKITDSFAKLYPNVIIRSNIDDITYQLDRDRMEQVIHNILLNAVQSMVDETGIITINATLNRKKQVEITITDTGQGIEPIYLEKIRDPFFTTKETGSGMGLAVVENIIKSHEGKLDIRSTAGEGTTVSITL